MKSDPLVVVSALSCMSLAVAFIVFYVLHSTAIVKTAKYQAGGALAGFIIVFGLLGGMQLKLCAEQRKGEEIQELKAKIATLERYAKPQDIAGTVDPYSKDTKLVLASTEADLAINRKFRLSAPCIDLANRQYTVYVMSEGKHYSYELLPDEDLSKVQITLPQ